MGGFLRWKVERESYAKKELKPKSDGRTESNKEQGNMLGS